MQDPNNFEHHDTTMGGTRRRSTPDTLRSATEDLALIPRTLTIKDKEAVCNLYFCPGHLTDGTGNEFTCPRCVRKSITDRHGLDALARTLVHLRKPDSTTYAVCGLDKGPLVTSDRPIRVTCPDCLIVDYVNTPGNDPLDAWTPPAPPPMPEPAEPLHLGPHWEHDCDACVYLGSRPHYDKQYDLYWCPPNKFSGANLIARHGTLGDYVSGMSFIDREPMLAVAAILALKQGYRDFIPGVKG